MTNFLKEHLPLGTTKGTTKGTQGDTKEHKVPCLGRQDSLLSHLESLREAALR